MIDEIPICRNLHFHSCAWRTFSYGTTAQASGALSESIVHEVHAKAQRDEGM